MNALLNAALSHIWPRIQSLSDMKTPDDSLGRDFTIDDVGHDAVRIATAAGSLITIQRAAFMAALRYLVENGHGASSPCEIRSNQVAEESGPLCLIARAANSNTRVINYIVPILARLGILGVGGTRPNTTWLI
ncbi:hypothetical protein [Variovorax sp. PDC80]|uniref:hypothetical protein n=1 Tax=Variovorax sp. PDC80 TaxID=1882827 RepID=UPI0011608804|nr:hypothetical protein [Variovorax sp. PDC80]